jgi:CheY-like chemotaxis protein
MDVQLPEMVGVEATRRIGGLAVAAPHVAPLRIIAMTANATEEDRRACFDAGMDDYIAKPIRVEELASALERSKTP